MRILASIAMLALATASAAEEPLASLELSCTPEGAKVFVDGEARGVAPCSVYEITPGRHLVHLEAPGFRVHDEFVVFAAGRNERLTCALETERALVLVRTEPSGAEVRCNGATLGSTPLLITSLPAGEVHRLELSLNGYRSRSIEVRAEGRSPVVREEKLVLDSGIVDCATEPPGATVVVNGVERGVTPIKIDNVPKGLATITFRLEGYQEEKRELRLTPGDSQTLSVALKGKPARLTVVSTPDQAKVFLDDDYQGRSPVTVTGLRAGAHKLRVELPGHAPLTRDITLANGGETTEEFQMESVLGRLEVVTTPPRAKISIDGKAVGTTRQQGGDVARSQVLAVEKLEAGEHSVQVRLDGFREISRKVVIKAKETRQLFLRLDRVFEADTEIETVNGAAPVRGVLISSDPLAVVIEVRPGVQRSIPRGEVRKITSLK